MDLPSLFLCLALFAGVAFIVVRPLLERHGAANLGLNPTTRLEMTRAQNLTALRDLDFDHATGKINDDDYQAQRAQLVAQGVALLKELDALGVSATPALALEDTLEAAIAQRRRGASAAPSVTKSHAPALSPDAAMEVAIAQQRARPAAARPAPHSNAPNGNGLACTQCGRPAQPGDKFCGKCGAALPQLAASAHS